MLSYMIKGIGTDIVEINRIANSIERTAGQGAKIADNSARRISISSPFTGTFRKTRAVFEGDRKES